MAGTQIISQPARKPDDLGLPLGFTRVQIALQLTLVVYLEYTTKGTTQVLLRHVVKCPLQHERMSLLAVSFNPCHTSAEFWRLGHCLTLASAEALNE